METRFQLENFAGPLDLLLYLVQREEVDIREIPLVRICDQYVEIMDEVKKTDIDRVGDFFVMAATLMAIKARSLLPNEEVNLAEELDQEESLIQQLLEYRKVKEASRFLNHRADARRLVHPSRPLVSDAGIPLDEVDLHDLVEAFRQILQETGLDRKSPILMDQGRPVSAYVEDLLETLRESPRIPFFKLFEGSGTREDLLGMFLAVLELIKARIIRARQEERFGEIDIEARGEIPDSLTSLPEPLTSDGSDRAANGSSANSGQDSAPEETRPTDLDPEPEREPDTVDATEDSAGIDSEAQESPAPESGEAVSCEVDSSEPVPEEPCSQDGAEPNENAVAEPSETELPDAFPSTATEETQHGRSPGND